MEYGIQMYSVRDITEQMAVDKMKQEFSANVSHELKTPLASISGYAEMIETGIAQAGDVQNFAHIIRKESGRLLSLINDMNRKAWKQKKLTCCSWQKRPATY